MSPTCGVCCVFVCFTVLCFLQSAEGQTNCVACTYQSAGDGTTDYACVNDPLSHTHSRNITCDFTTHSCVIKAVYRYEGYQELQSVSRDCLLTSATSEVCGYTDRRTCLLECKTNMCNVESNADLAKIYISSSGNLSNSVPAMAIVLQLVTCLSILSITFI